MIGQCLSWSFKYTLWGWKVIKGGGMDGDVAYNNLPNQVTQLLGLGHHAFVFSLSFLVCFDQVVQSL